MSNYSFHTFLIYFLQPVALKRVGAECAGAAWRNVSLHVNHISPLSLQGDHIEALAHQVVARNKNSSITLAVVPDATAESRRQREEEAQEETG